MSTAPQLPSRLGWFDAEDAPARVDINTCIHCGLCLTACPTYRELKIEPDSPRGRLYLMRGLAEGRIAPSDPLLGHLDLCLDCRACETVCPAGVPYSRLLEQARGQLSRRATKRTPLRALGEFTLRWAFTNLGRVHTLADLVRLMQSPPLAAFAQSSVGARLMPPFARRGLAMTPHVDARSRRSLELLARTLPPGARMEQRRDGVVFLPAGKPKMRVAFLTTCVMEVLYHEINRQAVRLLLLAGAEVSVPKAQTCCGALHAHAGLRRAAKDLARRNARAFAMSFGGGFDAIVTTSAGCGAALREYGHLLHGERDAEAAARMSEKARDVSEVLDELGLPAPRAPLRSARDTTRPLRIGYHDPCHLAHAQKVRQAPRRLLRNLPGVEVVDLPNSDWCCGSAGVYNLTHADMADAQLRHKLDTIEQVSPELVVASNPGCMLHMARGARERAIEAPVVHLVEVLAKAYPATR